MRGHPLTTLAPVRLLIACVTVVVLGLLAGCDTGEVASGATPGRPTEAGTSAPPAPRTGAAAAVLATLPVKGRAPMTGYDRDAFGPAWADADRNGCDTRNDVLARDLTGLVLEPGTHDCVVVSGILADPYTGTDIDFVRGDGFLVDIDHVVALGNAWATGAFRWEIRKRAALANDPLNLLAVDAGENRSKGDGDAATWLPPSRAVRCAYVSRQVAVKAKYDLWITPAEHDAIAAVLARCPDQDVPADSGAPTIAPLNLTDRTSSAEASPGSAQGTASGSSPADPSPDGSVSYENCDAVRAAGAAPVHRGDPGYGSHLDRDGDGVGCE